MRLPHARSLGFFLGVALLFVAIALVRRAPRVGTPGLPKPAETTEPRSPESSEEFVLIDDAGDLPEFELPVSPVTDGLAEGGLGLPPELPAGRPAALVIPLDSADDPGSTYRILVRDFGHLDLWEHTVPDGAITSGRLIIRLERLDPGRYEILIFRTEANGFSSIVAETRFRVL